MKSHMLQIVLKLNPRWKKKREKFITFSILPVIQVNRDSSVMECSVLWFECMVHINLLCTHWFSNLWVTVFRTIVRRSWLFSSISRIPCTVDGTLVVHRQYKHFMSIDNCALWFHLLCHPERSNTLWFM